jgi:LmbE family N-acetylglucosaminyl deacetylase
MLLSEVGNALEVFAHCDDAEWFFGGTVVPGLRQSHGDHIAAGEATLQAVYPEGLMPRIYPELLAEGWSPHEVTEVWLPAMGDAELYLDVTDVAETRISAIWCHASQNDREWLFEHRVAPG